jgi:type II secretory pathway pseudopilin PulG
MAIVMILAGVVVSGISNSSNHARKTSREMVKTHLQQARAHAIATCNLTALIIPVRESGKSGLRSMSLIEVEKIDGRYVPIENERSQEELLQRWTKLAQNMHFVTNSMIDSDQPTVVDHEKTLTIHQSGVEMQCHMIVFGSNGQIIYPSSGAAIHIAIAQVARKGGAFRINESSNQMPVFDLLLVNRLTANARNITP